MLSFPDSRIMQSTERPVAVGSTITAEGSALVADTTGGVFGVKNSGGNANEKFAGVSLAQQLTLTAFPAFDSLTASAGLAVTTTYTPTGGTLRVYNVTRAAVVAAGGGAGQYAISGSTITVVAGGVTVAGDNITVAYSFAPTVLQAQALMGQIPAGGAAALTLGSVGVITQGDIMTTEYDTTVDWAAANIAIATGANGKFTIGGSGAVVAGHVTKVPDATQAMLGIHFTA